MTLASVASVTDTMLRSLGITTLGQRKKLLAAAAAMVPAAEGEIGELGAQATPAHSSSRCAASPAPEQHNTAASTAVQGMTRGSSGSGVTGRITDFFQPKGGRRPAPPLIQTPLDGLLAAAKPRPTIANFFQPAAVGGSGARAAGRGGTAGASGLPAASAPACGPNASGSKGEVVERKEQGTYISAVGSDAGQFTMSFSIAGSLLDRAVY